MVGILLATLTFIAIAALVLEARAEPEQLRAAELEAEAAKASGERVPEPRELHGVSGATLRPAPMAWGGMGLS